MSSDVPGWMPRGLPWLNVQGYGSRDRFRIALIILEEARLETIRNSCFFTANTIHFRHDRSRMSSILETWR